MSKKIDYVSKRKIFFIISSVLVVLSILSTFFIKIAIEFKGGTMLSYSYESDISMSDVKAKAEEIIGLSINIQEGDDLSGGSKNFIISFVSDTGLTADKQYELTTALKKDFPDNNIELTDSNDVSPTTGVEFFTKCLVAVILASVLTIIYIAFRFRKIGGLSAGVCAVTALFHDVIIVYGVFNLCGFEISANFMAVILTILGYSINNTIVVYDRIRENEDILDEKTSFAELINTSLNQSFTRSIHTSVSTFIAMFVVCVVAVIFKVDTILTFSLPLMVGIVVGTYSSLCFAPNLWGWWCSRKGIATIKDAKQARKK